MRRDDPSRVYRRKGYGVVNRLNCYAALRGTDGVYPGSDRGCAEHFSPSPFGLVLIIDRASQYEVDGGQGSVGCSAPTIALLAAGAVSVPRVGSRMYLLRCPARINFSTRNFRLW